MALENARRRGRFDAAGRALEQTYPELFLELAEALRQGRLGEAGHLGCGAQAAMVDGDEEMVQLSRVQLQRNLRHVITIGLHLLRKSN